MRYAGLSERPEVECRSTGRIRTGVTAVALVATALVSAAQDQPHEPGEALYCTFETEVPLADLMEIWVGRLEVSLELYRSELDGTVSPRTPTGVDEDTFWLITKRRLVRRGLACIQAPCETNLAIVPLEESAMTAQIQPVPADARAGYIRAPIGPDYAEASRVKLRCSRRCWPRGAACSARQKRIMAKHRKWSTRLPGLADPKVSRVPRGTGRPSARSSSTPNQKLRSRRPRSHLPRGDNYLDTHRA